ncbi:hypothetical protein QQ045_022902 [Rhodiola kirilowii]
MDWKVVKFVESTPSVEAALAFDLMALTADSENLKSFSRSFGPAPDSDSIGVGGRAKSSLTRVFRAWSLSRNGCADIVSAPRQISAHELMKCHVDVPSRIAWLKAHPREIPSFSLVNCTQGEEEVN